VTAGPKAHIWVRSTAPWDDEAAFRAQLPERFAPNVDLWDQTFELPFHLFRARVREIAHANLERVEDAVVSEWDDIPEGALVLPVDDDDWFAPHAAQVASAALEPGLRGLWWPSTFVEVPFMKGHVVHIVRMRVAPWTRPHWTCSTNSYAMVKEAGTLPLMASHVDASEWYDGDGAPFVRRIPHRLNLVNRTLASQTTMGHVDRTTRPSELRLKHAIYRRRYRHAPVRRTPWARPYVAMMDELMERLELRGRAGRR
jgi:hypothetical protein